MCSIEGCDRKPKARGLCAMHYMRLRRTGNPEKRGKPGRPVPRELEYARGAFRDQSDRTQRRHARVIRLARVLAALTGTPAKEIMLQTVNTKNKGAAGWERYLEARVAFELADRTPEELEALAAEFAGELPESP